jgi:hypothetical protein
LDFNPSFPSLILQKAAVDPSGLKQSYLGPVETKKLYSINNNLTHNNNETDNDYLSGNSHACRRNIYKLQRQ